MIQFFKGATDIHKITEFDAWTEVENRHADKCIQNHTFYSLWECYKYTKDGVKVGDFLLWNQKSGDIWVIYDSDGFVGLDSPQYKTLREYAEKQYVRAGGLVI